MILEGGELALRLTDQGLGEGGGRDELLSLVLFRQAYAQGLAAQGRSDATAALAAGWRT